MYRPIHQCTRPALHIFTPRRRWVRDLRLILVRFFNDYFTRLYTDIRPDLLTQESAVQLATSQQMNDFEYLESDFDGLCNQLRRTFITNPKLRKELMDGLSAIQGQLPQKGVLRRSWTSDDLTTTTKSKSQTFDT